MTRDAIIHAGIRGLWQHCMAVYHGREHVSELALHMRLVLGWGFDQARRFIELCQQN
jgi:hypothetical protein